jgi:hypothetical protein
VYFFVPARDFEPAAGFSLFAAGALHGHEQSRNLLSFADSAKAIKTTKKKQYRPPNDHQHNYSHRHKQFPNGRNRANTPVDNIPRKSCLSKS